MSCLLSKFCGIKSTFPLRKISIPTNNFFPRRTFNRPFRPQKNHTNSLFGPTIFCISISCGSLVVATIVQYERLHNSAKQVLNIQDFYRKSAFKRNVGLISELKNRWDNFKPSEKVFGTILFLNTLVFLAWQVPRWQHIMVKYFATDALASRIPLSSMLLSAFSHSSAIHFGFNMYALHTFCRGVIQPWGDMGPEEFTAMYISSCVVSSLASIFLRRSMRSSGISLGASGAILSVVGYFALSHPNEKLGVIILPDVQFDAIYALFGIISLDSLGIILRWQMFDHAAHLGGTLFGMFWYKFVSKHVWDNRRYVVRNWIALKRIIRELNNK